MKRPKKTVKTIDSLGEEYEQTITENITKKEKDIDNRDAIKNFFAFQVDQSPETEEAAIEEIKGRNAEKNNEVAGQFGSIHLKGAGRADLYLNQNQHGYFFPRELKVNNPRELIDMIEAANKLHYQELLDFSSAKLASGIRINDLWRLRAIFGFTPTGDYTNLGYTVVREGKEDEKVAGINDLLEENSWFDPAKDQHAKFHYVDTVEDDYVPGDALNAKYTNIEDKDAMTQIMDQDYPKGWTSVKKKNGDVICMKNGLIMGN